MRVVDFESQRLTVYVAEGMLDRLAISRIPGIERGGMPLLVDFPLTFRRWDQHPATSVATSASLDLATPERVVSVPRGLDPQTELPAKVTEQKVSR